MLDALGRLRRQDPAALRLHRTAEQQRQVIGGLDWRIQIHDGCRGDIGRTIDDEAERPLCPVLAEQHDGASKIRVEQLRHRQQQRRSQGHTVIMTNGAMGQ